MKDAVEESCTSEDVIIIEEVEETAAKSVLLDTDDVVALPNCADEDV